ncbi:hypothetical protein FRC11_015053, partial [Ceratobasidium sp. 423]
KVDDAREEMWDLVIFVKVALAVMAALHEDTPCRLHESYGERRPAGYKPRWSPLIHLARCPLSSSAAD